MPAHVSRYTLYAAALALLAGSAGCSAGQFVWFSEMPAEAKSSTDFVISNGDLLTVRVLGHEDMSVHQRVRADGRIAVPIIGEVEAGGKRPSSLRAELEGRIKEYIVSPSVLLTVDERQPLTIYAMGEVSKPGPLLLEPGASVADALAAAGGPTEYAARDRIFLVRRRPSPVRIRFTYDWLSRNEAQAATFPLAPGDMLVVE